MKMWIARDSSGMLHLFREKPIYFNGYWRNGYAIGSHSFALSEQMFPEVTFENSPMEVELKLIEK